MSWFSLGGKTASPAAPEARPAAPTPRAAGGEGDRRMAALRHAQPMAEFSPEGRLTDANEAMCALLGSSREELLGYAYDALVPEKDRATGTLRTMWAKLSHGRAESGQVRLAGKSGQEVWLQASLAAVMDGGGLPSAVILTGADITALMTKAMEDAAELKLRTEIMDITSIVSYADTKGDIIGINEKFIEVSKYSRDELMGRPHNTTRHPDMPKEVFRELWQTIGRGKTFRGMIKNRAKDGTPYYVDAVVAPIMGENGKPKKYLGVRYDITEMEIERQNMRGLFAAIDANYAYIEFDITGTVLTANQNFLDTLGYALNDIVGKPHRMFVDPAFAASPAYMQFWSDLNAGKAMGGEFKRIKRDGADVWIQAVYAPVKDDAGRIFKVVKIATDVTAQKLRNADFEGQLAAIGKSQAVIEFSPDGKILTANPNFCEAIGYSLSEIQGQHHSMFVDPQERASPEYRMFWERLARGEFDAARYKRLAKGGREIWIQASYNPILDLNGKTYKVVKYASDITEQVKAARALQAAVDETQAVVQATKENDLTKRIATEGKTGDIQALCAGVNGIIDTMCAIVANTTEAASTISNAVAEITSGTDDLSRRTENQASSLEETSASMEEIASTIRQNSENAQQASKLATDARAVATEGGEIVTRAVTAMSRIEESSGKVSDIIGVIDEIAFQTNLLALNAAVEAARAGDAGRGFAVVASEVRSLAQRSSEAAKDIKALIVQSGSQVKDGVKLVNDAGTSLGNIVEAVNRVSDIVVDIANASREQAVGVEEINKAVSQMDEMTQQNSALVEENAAACRLLQEQAEDMAARMALFRLDAQRAEAISANAGAVRKPMMTKPAPAPAARPAARPPVKKVAVGGGRSGAAALQSDLRTAFNEEADWKEF